VLYGCRLLGYQRDEKAEQSFGPLTPLELLVALHNIDPSKADVKCAMRGVDSELMLYVCDCSSALME